MWAVSLPPICFWHAKKNIIYAWIVHRWIVNRWVVYREQAQPHKGAIEFEKMK